MFKRPRLSAAKRLVNAPSLVALLFITAACDAPSDTPDVELPVEVPAEVPETVTETPVTRMSMPAVWNTSALPVAPASVGIAGELGSTIAVSYADGGLQLFNFEAEILTSKGDLNVDQVGDGRFLMLSGTPVSIFPGIDRDGTLQAYIHGGELQEPIAYGFQVDQSGPAAGLCTAPPQGDIDGVMRLGYWTEDEPTLLQSGRIVQVNDSLVFLADEPVEADQPIEACLLEDLGATVFSAPVTSAVALDRNGKRHRLTLNSFGRVEYLKDTGELEPVRIRDGISVSMPANPVGMAGTGDARGGGYPGGLLVVAGEAEPGDYRVVLIDPSDVTLAPLGVPAAVID
ncbi:MAG: hypothetical protein QNI84_15760 [Henriciella sp.]|nr:hypothetical protein [Henriciella sp.]